MEEFLESLSANKSKRPIDLHEEIPSSDLLQLHKRQLIKYASRVMGSHGNLIFVASADFDSQHEGLMITQATTPVKLPGASVHVALKSRLTMQDKMIDLVTTTDEQPDSLWRPLQRIISILPHDVRTSPKSGPVTDELVDNAMTLIRMVDHATPEPLSMVPRRELPTFISMRNNGREDTAALTQGQVIDLRDEQAAGKFLALQARRSRA